MRAALARAECDSWGQGLSELSVTTTEGRYGFSMPYWPSTTRSGETVLRILEERSWGLRSSTGLSDGETEKPTRLRVGGLDGWRGQPAKRCRCYEVTGDALGPNEASICTRRTWPMGARQCRAATNS